MLLGYARVSIEEQNLDLSLDALIFGPKAVVQQPAAQIWHPANLRPNRGLAR
jgi:hypothetical protein